MPTEELQATLARERLARQLIQRGVDPATADTIAAGGSCDTSAGGAILEVAGMRATASDPASFANLAAHILATTDTRPAEVQARAHADDAGAAAAIADGKAAAARTIAGRNMTNDLAFR